MSFVRYIPRPNTRLLIAALLMFGVSCVKEELPDTDIAGDDDRIMVSAEISPDENTTRAYVAEGPVKEGTYYLFFYRNAQKVGPGIEGGNYKMATVEFGNAEGPTAGFPYYYDGNDIRKDLKWGRVYDEGKSYTSSTYYYLSNVNLAEHKSYSSSYWNHFTFNNPYVAGPLDTENGTNDLLSGSTGTSKTSNNKISFNLYHRLALLKVNIEVYPAEDGPYTDLSNAEVTISNLCTKVTSFRLSSPTSFYYNYSNNSYGSYTDLRDDTNPLKLVEPGSETIKWAEGSGEESENKYGDTRRVYSTLAFVMPPQSIPPAYQGGSTATNNRPKITVKVPKKDVTHNEEMTGYYIYSGYIPSIMFNADADGNIQNDTQAQTISLTSGTQLTITASLNSPNPNLEFAPVKVEQWSSKSTHTLKTKQAGIYNATDFRTMLALYKEGRYSELERFGYYDDYGQLTLQMWASMKLDIDEITESMKPTSDSPAFSFMFNGYTVTLTRQKNVGGGGETEPGGETDPDDGDGSGDGGDDGDGDGTEPEEEIETVKDLSGSEGQIELHGIVTGNENERFVGIKNLQNLKEVVALFDKAQGETPSSDLLSQMQMYGNISNIDNVIVFEIDPDEEIEIDAADIFQKIPEKLRDYTVYIKNYKNSVKVKFPKDDEDTTAEDFVVTCGKTDLNAELSDYSLFEKLAIKLTTGIASADEFYLLKDCYNNYTGPMKATLMSLFGTVSESDSKWTFKFNKTITLDGTKAYISMVPDPTNGKPDYSISTSFTIDFAHEKVPASTYTTSYIYSMLSGTGRAISNNSMSTIVSHYTNESYNNTNYSYLWYYGRFDFESNKWTFPLKSSSYSYSSTAYSTLFGQMVPDPDAGKFDYEFDLTSDSSNFYFSVTSMPNTDGLAGTSTTSTYTRYFYQNGSDTYKYPNTAADLKKVALGTYWPDEESGSDAGQTEP